MTWLAPGYLVAGIAAALGVLILHLIVTREPRTVPLPTARFAADVTALARPRALKPSDVLLMVLRMLAVLAAAAALARPIVHPVRRPVVRIVLADHSSAVASTAEVGDSVRAIVSGSDSIVAFDSTGISGALIRGLRAASALRERADSFELILVSPLVRGQLDAATDSIRSLWPGAVRLVRVRVAAPDSSRIARVDWREQQGGGAPRAVYAVSAGGEAVIAPFERDSAPPVVPPGAMVVARWIDGEPAAWELPSAQGCERTVRIGLPRRGDLALTPRFQRLRARLTGPCGAFLDRGPADSTRVAALAGGPGRVAAAAIAAPDLATSRWTMWLLLVAFILLLAEWMLRRRRAA